MSNVLITAGSGNIGVKLLPLLTERSSIRKIICPTSSAAKFARSVPSSKKIVSVEGSIQDPQWMEKQMLEHEVDTVFLNLTGSDELFTTMNLLSCIRRVGCVKHIVYLSACGDFMEPNFRSEVLKNCLAGHVIVKLIVEEALHALPDNFTWTAIGPTLFMENDLRAKSAMLNAGLYPEPLGDAGVSRVSTKDIAQGVANAIEDKGQKWNRRKVMIGSRKFYTGNEIAALWSDALGKPIKMQPVGAEGMEELESHFREHVGPAWARDLRNMYEAFERKIFSGKGFGMNDAQYQSQVELLDREPASYEEFVKQTAKSF